MSRFWSPVVQSLIPYVPGEQPRIDNLVKLNTNENPYGPSPRALHAMREAANDALRLYPDPDSTAFKHAVARRYGVEPRNVFVGNGSDEVLAHVFAALLRHDRPLAFPDVTYSFYPSYCRLFGIEYRTVALNDHFEIEVDAYGDDVGAIIFANPNAPTGHLLPLEAIESLAKRLPDIPVVVDEAYIDFGGESAVPLTRQYENLLVVQTLSKSRSLAGLRVGFAIGHVDLIEGIERVKNSFNSYPINRIALAGAVAAMEDSEWFETTRQRVIRSRERMSFDLRERGFEVLPSAANFVFARHPGYGGAALAAALRERAILVRHFALSRIDQFLRISVGTEEQCDALVNALDDILGKK